MGYQVYLDVTFKWQVSDIFQIVDISIMWVRKEVGTYFFFNSSSCSWFFQKKTGSGDKLLARFNSIKVRCGSLLNLHFLR